MTTTLVGSALAVFTTAVAGAASITGAYVGASNAHQGDFMFDRAYSQAKSNFQNAIPGAVFGTDSLEDVDLDTGPFQLGFGPTGVTGTLSSSGNFLFAPAVTDIDPQMQSGPLSSGPFSRQATDGEQFLFAGLAPGDSAALSFTFDPETVVRGFGFSVTDLGDFGATLTVSFFDGGSETLPLVPGNFGLEGDDFANGDHIWASFTTDEAIAGVSINLTGGDAGDAFSFDEFSVLVIPVPPAAALGGLGLLAAVWGRRRLTGRLG